MDFRILGPLEVRHGGGTVLLPLGGAKQRAVLALLILHRRELVSTDRLVDELWGERAPPTAAKTLQSYVSRLRKVLGSGVLQTQGHCYCLELAGHDLDAERFERLVAEARGAATDGDLEAASEHLDEALGLWRGAPLADIAYEPAVRTAAARLEELRLATVEDRVELELARGHDAEVVPELEALVREHPLRERLRGQHMLALYRCGRQAEALAAYQHARRALVDELGIDPGPSLHELEHKILAQDPALEGPRPPRPLLPRRPDPIRLDRLLVGIGCVVLAIALGAVLVQLARDGGGSRTAILGANAVGLIDLDSGKLAGAVPVPGSPARMVAAGGIVWVGSDGARTLSAIDPRSRSTKSLVAPGGFPTDLAVGEGALWVLDRQQGTVLRINPSYGLVERRIRLGGGGPFLRDRNVLDPWSIAAGAGAVWVTDGSRMLIQIDPRRGRVIRRIDAGSALDGVTVADGGVWAISGPSSSVLRIDPRRGRVTDRITTVSNANYASPYPIQIEGGAGALWVLNANTGTVSRIDPRQRGIVTTIRIGVEHVPLRLAVGPQTVWVASGDGTLTRIDARTNDAHGVRIAHALNDVAVAGGMVLATSALGSGTLAAKGVSAGAPTSVRALPPTFCSPVYHASGVQPRHLIAADLPLQGPYAFQGAQMAEAIQVVLRANHFKAGQFALGLQVCDDETASGDLAGFDKCAANARAYAGDPSVIGVVGPLTSGCAHSQIPILNRAPRGPLAIVSPSNTYRGLTQAGPGSAPGEPESLYPTGRRNYIRMVATDAVQGAANAELAHRLGVRRLFVVHDEEPHGRVLAATVRRGAKRRGVAIAGQSTASRPVATLASRIRQSGADGVFIGALLTPRAVAVLRAARRAVGPTGAILTPDSFFDDRLADQAGTAAEGLMVSIAGLPIQSLGRAGQRFVARFSADTGAKPLTYSVYAAQAAQVLLDAIARSDGTRPRVTRELFATKVRRGLLGDFDITPTGDTSAGAVTIYRIHDGRRRLVTVIEPAP